MSASSKIVESAPAQHQAEVFRQMSALDFARLIQVALGKLADERDWQVICRSNDLLEEQWRKGFEAGRKQGVVDVLAEAETPMRDVINRMMKGV
jgi:hypothetical protein